MFDAMKVQLQAAREGIRDSGLWKVLSPGGVERMTRVVWAVIGILGVCGCAASYGSRTESSGTATGYPSRPPVPPAVTTQPGCPEPSHEPFPASGSYVQVDELAEPVQRVGPGYPDEARSKHVQGTVLLRALVCEHGRVVKTEVAQSIPLLDEAASQAVMQWTYRPARSAGRAVAVWVDTPVRFTLH